MNDEAAELTERTIDLESRVAFQDQAIEELSRTVFEQRRAIDALALRVEALARQLRDVAGPSPRPSGDDEPPPHY